MASIPTLEPVPERQPAAAAPTARPVRQQPSRARAHTKPKAKSSQVNARIESELKQAGDAALASAGITPTQAVRAVWRFAAKNAGSPEKIAEFIAAAEEEPDAAALAERERKLEAARRGPKIMEEAYKKLGLPWPPKPSPLDTMEWHELRDYLREQYYREKGLID